MKKILIIATLVGSTTLALAQAKSSSAMPKLASTWGRNASGTLTPGQVAGLTDSSLRVHDDKGTNYPVAGFRINYTFVSTYKDQESGELKTTKEFRAFDFNDTTALTSVWKESIRENVKAGDEIVFNKILARQKNGKKVNAPSLTFKVADK